VQVARTTDGIVGYCTWRLHKTAQEFTGLQLASLDLTAVTPEARGKGVFTALVHDGLRWLQGQGLDQAEVVTHALNAGMQKCCAAMGGRTLAARHSMHWHRPEGG